MNYYAVSPNAVVGQDFRVLTYSSKDNLAIGLVVEISVGRKQLIGVVLEKVAKPAFECKEISKILTDRPLPAGLLQLHQWLSFYYTTHPGLVWQTMLPSGLNKNRRAIKPEASSGGNQRTSFLFTDDQNRAVSQILKMPQGTALLCGVTGSGKTAVYKALAQEAAARGKSSIVLVPEISLTAQLVEEFKRDFERVIVTHSGQTEAERHHVWLQALGASQPTVAIGPRSALFSPLSNLGLIVVDECHEPSYKQEKSPRYNALRAASVLAEKSGARLVLGSATPLIADYFTAKKLGRPIVTMSKLAKSGAIRPKTSVIDLTKSGVRSKNRIFSQPLLSAMEKTLSGGKQVLLFHNRRGTAPITLCENCGWVAMCPRCFVPLTLHADHFELRCHICGYSEKPNPKCPVCDHAGIIHRGIGTKMIAEEIGRLFPEAKVRRFDGDSIKGEKVHDLFKDLKSGEIDVIVGTQTIAKGLDLPNLALVGIVQADAGLVLPDFSASERTFQLIAQACGRVGRDKNPTEVMVQTYQPNHPAVRYGVIQDYAGFYEYEIKNRARGHFPPFSYLLKLTNSYKTEKGAVSSARKLATDLGSKLDSKSSLLGPTPAFYERQRDNWRWQIIVRSPSRAELIKLAATVPPAHWQAELDPNSLI